MKKIIALIIVLILLMLAYYNTIPERGEIVDKFNGVAVYYNGGSDSRFGQNIDPEGYNIGRRYESLEFVKRYYYELYRHKMPNSYGNAIEYFMPDLVDGEFNSERGLVQYTNPSGAMPKVNDIIVLKGKQGEVGIVTAVTGKYIEIIQQDKILPRRKMSLKYSNNKWLVDNSRVFGWLRLQK